MLSKPIKAQGEIKAIFIVWERAEVSGTKAGDQVPLCRKRAATKTMVIPAAKTQTRTVITAMDSL